MIRGFSVVLLGAMFHSRMTLDLANRMMTAVVATAVGVGLLFTVLWRLRPGVLGLLAFAVALTLAWAMSPREVVVSPYEVRVLRRAWRPLRIPLTAVDTAAPIDSLGALPLRLFGVGGFFGSYGLFSSVALGRFHLYATRRGQAVLVRRNDRKLPVVLTPDDVAGTVAAIRQPAVLRGQTA